MRISFVLDLWIGLAVSKAISISPQQKYLQRSRGSCKFSLTISALLSFTKADPIRNTYKRVDVRNAVLQFRGDV